MDDLVIDMAPVLRWRRAMKTLERTEQPAAGSIRQRLQVAGEDPVAAAVGFLEALVASGGRAGNRWRCTAGRLEDGPRLSAPRKRSPSEIRRLRPIPQETSPSAEDLAFTRRMAEAGELLGLALLDHLILGSAGRWVSLGRRGAW